MPEQSSVKVFISWSGDLSRQVAVALREWLPLLFDRVEPWASDTDIAAGQRGLGQIEAELANTRFGIVVITSDNQHAPWLNFEAGALSRTITEDVEHRVVPLLVDLSGPSQLVGPLAQFQAKVADRNGLCSLLQSLGEVAGIEQTVITQRFDAYWPQLEDKLTAAKEIAGAEHVSPPRREVPDVLDEILVHVRVLSAKEEATDELRRGLEEARRMQAVVEMQRAELHAMRARVDQQHRQLEVVPGIQRLANQFGFNADVQEHRDKYLVMVSQDGSAEATGSHSRVLAFETALQKEFPGLISDVGEPPPF